MRGQAVTLGLGSQSTVTRTPASTVVCAAHKCDKELRICVAKGCKRQGSLQMLKFAQELDLKELHVKESPCLGNCGQGPNMMLEPVNVLLHHVATPNDLAEALHVRAGVELDRTRVQAAELLLAGNVLASNGKYEAAVAKYTEGLQALGIKPGRHLLLANRSAAYLHSGNKNNAITDAEAAVASAPRDFTMAWVRLIEANVALGRIKEAIAALDKAVKLNPAFKDEDEYEHVAEALGLPTGRKTRC